MPRRFLTLALSMMLPACAGLGQTPQAQAPIGTRIYILLKPTVAEPGAARDAFAQRMTALGVVNLQFVSGAAAAKGEAPVAAQAAVLSDADVSAVLPIDAATPAIPAAPPPAAPSPPPSPVISTPPYIPPPPSIPISAGAPMGGGMSAGMAMLSDFAGNMVVKLLTPGSACKIRLHGRPPELSSAGGSGAFEVKASGNCAWQAVSTADWLHVKTEVNVSGTVAVVYNAASNPGGHRQAVVVIQPVAGMATLKGHTVTLVGQQ